MKRREAIMRLIEKAQAAADRAWARGQFRAHAKHLARVGQLLNDYDAA